MTGELIPPGETVLVAVADADDATLFCGGTLRLMTEQGAKLILLRVTDDRFDSIGLDVSATIARNSAELRVAADIIGFQEIIDLGWQTDCLGDASEVSLRERLIYHVRRVKPYAVVSFDPYGILFEDNQDHLQVAAAVDETYWTSQFDKHHPEHFAEGLAPHGVYERWYFARRLAEVTTPVDISATIDAKVDAASAHQTMIANIVHQLRLQARTGRHTIPELEEAADGELRPLVDRLLRSEAMITGARHGLSFAEEFRVVRFGGMEDLFGVGRR